MGNARKNTANMFDVVGLQGKLLILVAALLFSVFAASAQSASRNAHWVASWSAPLWLVPTPQAPEGAGRAGAPPAAPPPQASGNGSANPSGTNSPAQNGAAAPAAPPTPASNRPTYRPVGPILPSVSNQTIRMVGRLSMGGSTFRIRLANAFSAPPVTITEVHAALRVKDAAIDPASDRTITFGKKTSVTLQPGVELMSDPFNLDAASLAHFAVTLYIESDSGPTSHTALASHVITYLAATPGNFIAAKDLDAPKLSAGYYWLSGIDVLAPANAATVVAMGDSITDATGSPFEDQDWPSQLAARFSADKRTRDFSVVNVGISGNRVLRDGNGTSGLSRFDRNVLSQPNVRWLVLLEGINDIGSGTATADDLISAYQQIIEKAHEHQVGVVGCTILPFKGAFYYSDQKEKVREAVNSWIRSSGAFDAVVDFEAAVRDPADPLRIREDMHRGDYLHPNPVGYEAMSKAFDLSVFLKPPKM